MHTAPPRYRASPELAPGAVVGAPLGVHSITDAAPRTFHWLAKRRPTLTIPLTNVINRFSPTRFIRRNDRLHSPRTPSAADKRFSLEPLATLCTSQYFSKITAEVVNE